MTIERIVRDSGAGWTHEAPASREVVEQLAAAMPMLPDGYLAFLLLSNGGEGSLGVGPGWFSLWPAEEVAELNDAYKVSEFLPGFVAFGSDGGGEMLAFRASGEHAGHVFAVPFIPMEVTAAVEIAPDFESLLRSFGHDAPAA
jgi:hypothetical protein